MKRTSRFFKALSDQTRLKILWLLFRKGKATLHEIEHVLEVPRTRLVNHLKYLQNAGVVRVGNSEQTSYRVMQQTDPFRQTTLDGLRCRLAELETPAHLESRLDKLEGPPG